MPTSFLRRLLAHPLTASLPLDDPAITELRKKIILSKPLLKSIYDEWYQLLARELPSVEGQVLELGSGAGYCGEFIRDLITSETTHCLGVRVVADAQRLPFADRSLRAIVMTNVMHHIPDAYRFFAEASRCLRLGGKLLMIDPWLTSWSRIVYKYLHPEAYSPEATDWSFASTGPLSGANTALPWIVFGRDRGKFEAEFPEFSIEKIQPMLPFRYLVSGGVSMRSLMPGFTHSAWKAFEHVLQPHMHRLGTFTFIALVRR